VQDCLMRAQAAWAQRREEGALRPWLLAILHNTWRNRMRREQIRPDGLTLDEIGDALGQSGGQAERMELLDLDAAMSRLNEEQRSLLMLIAVEGLSYEEAASVQGVPIGTVMSRLTRARERLRKMMMGESGADPDRPRLRRVK